MKTQSKIRQPKSISELLKAILGLLEYPVLLTDRQYHKLINKYPKAAKRKRIKNKWRNRYPDIPSEVATPESRALFIPNLVTPAIDSKIWKGAALEKPKP